MSFLNRILEVPAYGFEREGALYVPARHEIFREFFSRLNITKTRKNWLPFWGWFMSAMLSIPFFIFIIYYRSWPLAIAAFFYSMVALGTHGTIYLHRYGTHRGFQFRNRFWLFLVRNLVIKIIPEEIYVVSHHVHHKYSEKPGDPYNVHAGFLYCFLADVNHQLIARDLSERDYARLRPMLTHMGVRVNSYDQYQKWGTLAHPLRTVLHYLANWAFWYGTFYWLGGHALATALFGGAAFWAFGVRTFNYDGHGRGIDRRREGIDFNREDFSVNQVWPGYVASEWHNNHHLYPNAARCGFLPYQLDLAWYFIRGLYVLGGVVSFKDPRAEFYRDHYLPYLARKVGKGVPHEACSTLQPCPAHAASLIADESPVS